MVAKFVLNYRSMSANFAVYFIFLLILVCRHDNLEVLTYSYVTRAFNSGRELLIKQIGWCSISMNWWTLWTNLTSKHDYYWMGPVHGDTIITSTCMARGIFLWSVLNKQHGKMTPEGFMVLLGFSIPPLHKFDIWTWGWKIVFFVVQIKLMFMVNNSSVISLFISVKCQYNTTSCFMQISLNFNFHPYL